MKRSALKRGKPLARGTKPLKRRGRLKVKGGRLFAHVVIDGPYLASLRAKPCVIVGGCHGPIDPHHVIPRSHGGGDETCVPLCRAHHHRWHTDRAFREATTSVLLGIAAQLWATYLTETGKVVD